MFDSSSLNLPTNHPPLRLLGWTRLYLTCWFSLHVLFVALLLVNSSGEGLWGLLDPALYNFLPSTFLLPVWLSALVLIRRHAGFGSKLGRALALMATGGMCWSIGVHFFLYYATCDRIPFGLGCAAPYFPYPSPADVIFPFGTLLASAGLVLLLSMLGLRSREILRSLWIFAPLGLITFLVMGPPIEALGPFSGLLSRYIPGTGAAQNLTSTWYLAVDILLISTSAFALFHCNRLVAGRFFRPALLLVASMITIYACDLTYLYQAGNGTYSSGGLADFGYGVGDLLLATAILGCIRVIAADPMLSSGRTSQIDCQGAINAIADAHERTVGALARSIALTTPGIEAGADGRLVAANDAAHSLRLLVTAYRTAFGRVSTRLSVRATFLASTVSSEVRAALARVIPEGDLARLASQHESLQNEHGATLSALAEVHQRNEQILNSVGDGILGFDDEGRVIFANPAAATAIGTGIDLLCLLTYDALFCSLESGQVARPSQQSARRLHGKVSVHRHDGSMFPASFTTTPLFDDVRQYGYVIAFRDLSDQLEVDRMKSEFVSIVSHELRTPLTSIRATLGMLPSGALGQLTANGQRMVSLAMRNADRLTLLISDLLELQQVGNAEDLERVDCDLDLLVREAIDTARTGMPSNQIEIQQQLDGRGITITGHRGRLLQSLDHLLANAVKFSNPDSVITVRTLCDGDTARVQVQDHGIGISPEDIDRIFDPFFQADSSDTRRQGGTGLGLAISHEVARQHLGQLDVSSELGVGSTFTLTLPTTGSATETQLVAHPPTLSEAR